MRQQRPQGVAFVFYRKRWPAVAAAILGLLALILVWTTVGFLLGVLAAVVVGGVTYRYGHSLGSGQ